MKSPQDLQCPLWIFRNQRKRERRIRRKEMQQFQKVASLNQTLLMSSFVSGSAPSLSDSCLNLLGKPLRKEEQVSDWDLRPLTQTQEHYAALDAHSLLGLFVAMTEERTIDPHYQQTPLHSPSSIPIPPVIWTQYLSNLNK
jgi:hypothetical protein